MPAICNNFLRKHENVLLVSWRSFVSLNVFSWWWCWWWLFRLRWLLYTNKCSSITGIIFGNRAGTFPLLQTTQYLFTRCGWCYFARTDFLLIDGNDDVIDGIDGVASETQNKKHVNHTTDSFYALFRIRAMPILLLFRRTDNNFFWREMSLRRSDNFFSISLLR